MTEPRVATCTYGCGMEYESHPGLAFFEDRSAGSKAATETCKHCRCAPLAHQRSERPTRTGYPDVIGEPHQFEPHGPFDTDQFYCGCRGWD